MSSWLGQFHDFTKKYDPLGHEAVDGIWKTSTKSVNETSRGFQNIGDKWGWNTDIPEYGKNLSGKDKNSFNRWGENTIGGIGAVLGGMYAAGASGAGGGASGIGEVGASGLGGVGGGTGGGGLGTIGTSGGGAMGGYAEAGGGFVGNSEFLGSGGTGSAMNPQLFSQLGNMGGGGNQQGQANADALARQQALIEMMRRKREEDARAAEMPGWVEMGSY